jgi:Ca2+-binding EF-hand superfamily protein
LLKGSKEKKVFKTFISSFDSNQDTYLEFEEFLELLGVTMRSTIQKRLEGKKN